MTDRLTADDVRNTSFGKPPSGKRGYNEGEVDAFFGRIEAAIAGLERGR